MVVVGEVTEEVEEGLDLMVGCRSEFLAYIHSLASGEAAEGQYTTVPGSRSVDDTSTSRRRSIRNNHDTLIEGALTQHIGPDTIPVLLHLLVHYILPLSMPAAHRMLSM